MKWSEKADLSGLDKKYHELYRRAIDDMEVVLKSQHFIEAMNDVMGDYKTRLAGELSSWKSKTTEQIVARLIWAIDKKLVIRGYYTSANVIGYGLPSDDITRVNTRYLQGERADVAKDRMERGSNLAHEKGHDADFDHDYKATSRRRNSICYVISDAYKLAYWKCFPDESGTIAKPPVTQKKPVKVYKKKPWWKFW